jgi:hypothetical protein
MVLNTTDVMTHCRNEHLDGNLPQPWVRTRKLNVLYGKV